MDDDHSWTTIMDDNDDIGELRIWYALHQLESKLWHDVDFNGGRCAHEFYCTDGLFAVGGNRFEGRGGISAFYEWRRGRGETSTRHIVSNMVLSARGGRSAKAAGLITVHRGRGIPPFRSANVPVLVADFASECILGDDGVWRFASHILDPVFVDQDAPPSLAVDPRFLAIAKPHSGSAAAPAKEDFAAAP
jgi:hypothetical protein